MGSSAAGPPRRCGRRSRSEVRPVERHRVLRRDVQRMSTCSRASASSSADPWRCGGSRAMALRMIASMLLGEPRPDLARSPRRGAGEVRRQRRQRHVIGDLEGTLERQRLEERDPHRVDVAPDLVGGDAQQAFGRHVHRRPGTVAHLLASWRPPGRGPGRSRTDRPIGPPVVQEDVRRLDVAMGDPLIVGVGQGPRGLRPGSASWPRDTPARPGSRGDGSPGRRAARGGRAGT